MVKEENLLFLPSGETTALTLSRVSLCIRLACPPGFLMVSRAPSSILACSFLTLWGAPVGGSCWSPRKQAEAAFCRAILSITAADSHRRDNSLQEAVSTLQVAATTRGCICPSLCFLAAGMGSGGICFVVKAVINVGGGEMPRAPTGGEHLLEQL